MADENEPVETDAHTGTATTGHEWDGIKELDTPLPRWWLWIFYATIIWSVVYMVFMPAIPGLPGMSGDADHTRGLRNHSERVNVAAQLEALHAARAEGFARLEGASMAEIENDPDLLAFVRGAGQAAFGDNCATCHGAGAQGFVGYPNLNDDVWLWGGTYDEIRTTLLYGIRSDHGDTRWSQMPAYGRDGILSRDEISDVTDFVLRISGGEHDADGASRGAETYGQQCASCHGMDGQGDRLQGAPSLVDAEWLYGGSREQIEASIYRGPYGVMPAWEGRLDQGTIDALAAYVYTLGGGEAEASGQ